MRCLSCNAALTDFEATRKSANTEQYIDLCNHCFYTVSDDILTIDRDDLATDETEETGTDEILNINHCGMDSSVDNRD
jgi:hypothetical protein